MQNFYRACHSMLYEKTFHMSLTFPMNMDVSDKIAIKLNNTTNFNSLSNLYSYSDTHITRPTLVWPNPPMV